MIGRLVVAIICALSWLAALPAVADDGPVTIGSKAFTESVILGEAIGHLAKGAGVETEHIAGLGGTRVLWNALLAGEIDIYPEYTGTIAQEIFAGEGPQDEAGMRAHLAELGILMSRPLGFNNTYAVGMREAVAAELGIETLSDLQDHADLALGFSNEFMDRADGWPGLKSHYRLPQTDVTGLDHELSYRGLESGDIDAIDLYSTDAEISYYGLRVLIDDRDFFPSYNAVLLYRADLAARLPDAVAAIRGLEGRIDEASMAAMNASVKLDGLAETRVAGDFVEAVLAVAVDVREETWVDRLARNTVDHLILVVISLAAAIAVALPLGALAARSAVAGTVILGLVGIIQTVPSLALFVFMIPLLGIGGPPAIMALFLYSLMPIVRNTHAGLTDIGTDILESARAMGLPPASVLWRVELPIAGPTVMAGIKTSAVINVGTATLGGLIGAGGYGQAIFTGIRLDDIGMILQGAVPAALLALAVQGAFDMAERAVVPRGLRLKPAD
ncbi:MAG: ABC transporter permease subunit [Alphaproteobacteria bacterium]|nr:ABC transporter permease subunit [Alphaproteobacteria bacterium]MCZ6763705.1 ABC transporter permease subunit [Alphaproteobacteria bacterium]